MPLLSHQKLLFLHIPKNAGKSIEQALGLGTGRALYAVGRRSKLNRVAALVQRASANPDALRVLHGTLDVPLCAQHLTLQELTLLGLLPKDRTGLRTFAVFRDPFERAVSTYRHFLGDRTSSAPDFERFCEQWYDSHPTDHNSRAHRRTQTDFIVDCRGKIGVDRVLRFEHLAADFATMCSDWHLDCEPLPCIEQNPDASMAVRLLTPRARELLAARFTEDLAFFESLGEQRRSVRGGN